MSSFVYVPRNKVMVTPTINDSGKSLQKGSRTLPAPEAGHKQVGARWGLFLQRQYGADYYAYKRISQDFRCDARTAKAWLAGQKPDIGQLARAAQLYGAPAIVGVLHPDDKTIKEIALIGEIDQLKQRLQYMQQLIGEVSGERETTA